MRGLVSKKGLLGLILSLFVTSVLTTISTAKAWNSSDSITVKMGLLFDDANGIIQLSDLTKSYGNKVSFDESLNVPTGYEFVYWVVNGTLEPTYLLSHRFKITHTLDLLAVFAPTHQWAVLFTDSNGHLIDTQYVDKQSNSGVQNPFNEGINAPSKPGMTIASTPWKSTTGQTSLATISTHTVFVVQYASMVASQFLLNVEGLDHPQEGYHSYNSVVSLSVATTKSDDFFLYWLEGTTIVSYQPTYQFTMLSERTLTPVYGPVEVTKQPIVHLSNALSLRDNFDSYVGQYEIPEGYEVLEFGFLLAQSNYELLTTLTADVMIAQSSRQQVITHEFLTSFLTNSYHSMRAYIVVLDGLNSNPTTYYSDKSIAIPYTLTIELNGGTVANAHPATYTVTTPTFSLQAPTRFNSTFLGWFEDASFTTVANSTINQGSIGDKQYYAKWQTLANELFISEYIEGTGYNRAIEIYNGTGQSTNLSGYKIELYTNTNGSVPSGTNNLTGTLAPGETLVLYHSSASEALKNLGDLSASGVTAFTGDDVVILKHNGVIIDWVGGALGAQTNFGTDVTLVRKPSITGPNVTYTPSEWLVYGTDKLTYLGSHTYGPH